MARPPLLDRLRVAWRVVRADSNSTRAPWDDWWYTAAGAQASRSSAGASITPETALTLGAVYRAVRLLSDDVAQLPLHVYRSLPDRPSGLPGGKERLRNDLAEVIGKRPNARQTSYEFRQMLTSHLLLRGNGYARITAGARGAVSELNPIHPARVTVRIADTGRKVFLIRTQSGEETLGHDDVFHLCGFSSDPDAAEGMSPVTLARTSLGLTMATEEFGARQFSQTPRPSFLLEHPGRVDKEAAERISASFRETWAGPSGWGGVPLLEDGMKAAAVGMSHDDAQYLQTRQFQVTDVARWFGVPPHMIGDLSRATFSNIEQQAIDYVTHSLMPWLVLWEQTIGRDLILDDSFAEHVVDGLLRGDAVSRAQTEQLYINMRATTPNEVRARNNWNPVEWGDVPAMPQGAPAPLSEQGPPRRGPAPPPAEDAEDEDETEDDAMTANRLRVRMNGSARHG